MATAEFSDFAGILSAALSQHHLLGCEVKTVWRTSKMKYNSKLNFQNSAVATGLEKSVFIPIPKKGNYIEYSNYSKIALISHASKVMLKIHQARLQHYMNCELQMFKLNLKNEEEPRIKLPTSVGSSKEQESSRKKHLLLLY